MVGKTPIDLKLKTAIVVAFYPPYGAFESKKLFEQAPELKFLWTIEGAAHESFYQYVPQKYERSILAFFQQFLQKNIE